MVICDPAGNTSVGQFHITNASDVRAGLSADPTSGTWNMAMSVSATQTIMTWSRLIDNGNPKDAQMSIDASGLHNVVFVIGGGPSLSQNQTAVAVQSLTAADVSPAVVCGPAALDGKLSLSWSLKGSIVSFTATLLGSPAW